MMSDPLLLTEEEAAHRLLMSARSLRDLRKAGQIRYVAITKRKIAYRPEDLEAYVLHQLRQEEPAPAPTERGGRRVRSVAGGRAGRIIPFSERHRGK